MRVPERGKLSLQKGLSVSQDSKLLVVESASGSPRYEEARLGEILRRNREGNGDLGDRKIAITEKGWRVPKR